VVTGTAVHQYREQPMEQQQPARATGQLQRQSLISNSSYRSAKNYNNNSISSDYHVPTTTARPQASLPELQRMPSSARPMVPPPAPPPSAATSVIALALFSVCYILFRVLEIVESRVICLESPLLCSLFWKNRCGILEFFPTLIVFRQLAK